MNLKELNEASAKYLVYNPEAKEYNGCSYQLGSLSIIQREAKTTPQKVGQFVTLWKRNPKGETCPLEISDRFDYVVIICETQEQIGHFLFPKEVLAEKGHIRSKRSNGKRGFRVYPAWDNPTSKQAKATQSWQLQYFSKTIILEIT